jgi:hypothetical protein
MVPVTDMNIPGSTRRRHRLSILLLALLLFRSYIPIGFMPAGGQPFRVELCPAAASLPMAMPMAMPMPAHHHHQPGLHGHFTDCPFGCASTAGPLSDFVVFSAPARITSPDRVPFVPLRIGAEAAPAHPARGPPSPA